jgi:DNA-binding PadR family transcriptional regulator
VPTRLLGDFEQAVLLAVARLGDDAYGVAIRRDISQFGKNRVSVGALYVTLERLESKGYLRSRMGEATAVRGGRAKRFYTLTASGASVLRATRERHERMWAGVDLRTMKKS